VGSSVVNALSSELVATVRRDGQEHEQRYSRGLPASKLKLTNPKIRGTGTKIFFRPDEEIFGAKLRFDAATVRDRLEAKTYLHHSWSGDLVSAVLYYLPKGTKGDVLSFWGPDKNGVVQNDTLWVLRKSKKPVLAHAFLNFMLDEKNAYDNFVQFTGYTPPQNTIQGDVLVKRGVIPKSLSTAILRPDQFANNQELLALSVAGQTRWQNAWSKFKAG